MRLASGSVRSHQIITSFSDLGKGQAGASLEVNVVGVYESTESTKWFAAEEVGLSSLAKDISTVLR